MDDKSESIWQKQSWFNQGNMSVTD